MVYITCPSNTYTGGPTLAHQLCYILNQNGIEAKMLYDGKIKKNQSPIHSNYQHYRNPYEMEIEDRFEDTIIILETKTKLIKKYPKAKKYIWWMSVDNFFISQFSFIERILRKMGIFSVNVEKEILKRKNVIRKILSSDRLEHLVQSEYARLFLVNNEVDKKKIYFLTDYIEDEMCNIAREKKYENRKNIVLYNPKKGMEFTQRIINEMKDIDVEFKPLINMTKSQVIEALCEAKLYIDFGNHPGKDRFPREAVLCGCCILTGKRGAAANDVDIPIKEKYKFDDIIENIPFILDEIKFILNNYDECWKDYEQYQLSILNEKERFINEALTLFS